MDETKLTKEFTNELEDDLKNVNMLLNLRTVEEKQATTDLLIKKPTFGNLLAEKIVMAVIKKSCRATKEALLKEKKQIFSIQIDLGVNMMTGTLIRDPFTNF